MSLILKYLKKYKMLVFFNFISVFGFALVELGIPTLVAGMIDEGIAKSNSEYVGQMAIIIIIISIIGVLGSIALSYCSTKVSLSVTRDLRNDIFEKVQTFSHVEINQFGVSSLITRTNNDAYQIQQFVAVLLRTALLAPIMFVVSMMLTLRTSLPLTLVLAATVPVIVLGVYIIAKTSEPISTTQQESLDQLNLITRENLTGIRVIRAFRNDEHEFKRFQKTNDVYTNSSKRLFKLMSITQPTFFMLMNLAILTIFWMAANMINVGTLQVGQLTAFLEYCFHAMFSMMIFCSVFIMYPRAQVSANRISELMKAEPAILNPINGKKEGSVQGELKFEHVSFVYPRSEEAILKDISFTAHKGEKIAFIGSTGSGKSTLIHLIPRFYDVSHGSITLNGVDVREYELEALRNKIGFISQKAMLFSGSIANNISFGKEGASLDEIEAAAKVAQAYDFITQKEKGFEEEISEGGSNVSGGQKQRLSIARALVRKPEIYIFDDSFSALDFKTDAILREKLKDETKEAIVLIVAQRVSTIMDADQIIVLNEGLVVGHGTHDELLKNCEIYHEIASSQLSEEELSR